MKTPQLIGVMKISSGQYAKQNKIKIMVWGRNRKVGQKKEGQRRFKNNREGQEGKRKAKDSRIRTWWRLYAT